MIAKTFSMPESFSLKEAINKIETFLTNFHSFTKSLLHLLSTRYNERHFRGVVGIQNHCQQGALSSVKKENKQMCNINESMNSTERSGKLLLELTGRNCCLQPGQGRTKGEQEASRHDFHMQRKREERHRQRTAWAKEEKEKSPGQTWRTPNISVWQGPNTGEEHNLLFKVLSIKFNKGILKYWST